jgi:hypothetical protein
MLSLTALRDSADAESVMSDTAHTKISSVSDTADAVSAGSRTPQIYVIFENISANIEKTEYFLGIFTVSLGVDS